MNTASNDVRRLFGTSGIRGIVGKDLTADSCRRIAQATGSILQPGSRVCIATDTRLSREVLKEAVISGFVSCGVDVVDLGILPTPALALLTRELRFDTGIMITASHNPPEFNGIKLFNANSLGYSQVQEADIERVYATREFRKSKRGIVRQGQGMKEEYLKFIQSRFVGNLNCELRTVVDPGNGAASGFASDIFATMGLNVVPLNDHADGLFPGRSPEPREETLQETVRFLQQEDADLAVCFDGDADRVVFCDREGFLGFDQMTAFISRLVVKQTGKKTIATTVETGGLLDMAVEDLRGRVVRGKVGDVEVAYLAQELDAALGVEGVGVYIIPQVGYYPDSIFATLSLLGQLGDAQQIREFFKSMPSLYSGRTKIPCPNQLKRIVMAGMQDRVQPFGAREVNVFDGLRLEFDDGWMLVRASGTEPIIRILAEFTSPHRATELLAQGSEVVRSCLDAESEALNPKREEGG